MAIEVGWDPYLMPAFSILHSRGGPQADDRPDCDSDVAPLQLSETQQTTVRYTYRVTWNVSFHKFHLHGVSQRFIDRNLTRHG